MIGVPRCVHLRDALREVEWHVVHLRGNRFGVQVYRVAAQVGGVAQVGVQVSWAGALTGMPSLARWLFILITTGSSGPGVLSSGVATGDASASMD